MLLDKVVALRVHMMQVRIGFHGGIAESHVHGTEPDFDDYEREQ